VADLLAQNIKTGGSAQIQADDGCWIYYLVTKVRFQTHIAFSQITFHHHLL
jgi:hypothetical protein